MVDGYFYNILKYKSTKKLISLSEKHGQQVAIS